MRDGYRLAELEMPPLCLVFSVNVKQAGLKEVVRHPGATQLARNHRECFRLQIKREEPPLVGVTALYEKAYHITLIHMRARRQKI